MTFSKQMEILLFHLGSRVFELNITLVKIFLAPFVSGALGWT